LITFRLSVFLKKTTEERGKKPQGQGRTEKRKPQRHGRTETRKKEYKKIKRIKDL